MMFSLLPTQLLHSLLSQLQITELTLLQLQTPELSHTSLLLAD